MSDKPTTGEWTAEPFTETFPSTDFEGRPFLIPHTYKVVCGSKIICTSPFKEAAEGIADAHNAALAASFESGRIKQGLAMGTEIHQLREQLAAERDSWDISPTIRQLREQVQTLVDALKELKAAPELEDWIDDIVTTALAKVKEAANERS